VKRHLLPTHDEQPPSSSKQVRCNRCAKLHLKCTRGRPCTRCRNANISCIRPDDRSKVGYEEILGSYEKVYPMFPVLHPTVLDAIHEVAWAAQKEHRDYFMAILDAVAALISLYTGDTSNMGTVLQFYQSAKQRMDSIREPSAFEFFITKTILVSHQSTLVHCVNYCL